MKKIISLILSLVMILSFTACGTKAEAGWKEQYDLGIKYVNEAKYDEAILAFTKALEIDPKQAPVYISLAEVYVRQENYTAAQETLDKAITEIGQTDELLAEKDKLNDKQIPQNNNSGEGGIPPQYYPVFSADAVPGVVKTEGNDYNNDIYGYDSVGRLICHYYYNTDGSLGCYYIYTYDANDNRIREDQYDADGSLFFYYINTYNENGDFIRSDSYNADGILGAYYIYTYDADGVQTGYTRYNSDGSGAVVVEY